jgi:hypothetical protein
MTAAQRDGGPKFCKDCRWCSPEVRSASRLPWRRDEVVDFDRSHCSHPALLVELPHYMVAGAVPLEAMPFCQTTRKFEDKHLCGPDAKLFEPKS